jgi:hypothetical protein
MNCSACGRSLPAEALACPNCGSYTPLYYSRSGSSPHAPTAVSTAEAGKLPMPPTNYGVGPSDSPPPLANFPYASNTPLAGFAVNPYEVAPPPPTPTSKKGSRRGALIGVLVGLVVLLVLAGLIVTFRPRANSPGIIQAQPTAGPTQLAATATALASRNPYPPYTGSLVLNDPLRDNSTGYQWSEGKQPGNTLCGFSGGAYHMSLSQKGFGYCGPKATGLVFSNLAFEANITIPHGDFAGIWFRYDQSQGTRYLFFMDTQGSYGVTTDENDFLSYLRQGNRPAAFRLGPQTNLLAIVAIGNTIAMYVNHQFLASITDTSYRQGQIGAFAQGINGGFDIIISDVRVWKL